MRIMGILSAGFLLLGPLSAWAQDLPITAFYGTWQGAGVEENADSQYFAMTARDFDMVISAARDGFAITWVTVIAGDSNDPDVQRRESNLVFERSKRPGIYEATDSGNPMEGEVLSWARIDGNTLSIHQMALNDRGGFNLSTYDRTLTSEGMELIFRRLRDGEQIRSVTGRLIKKAG